jgi:hypothetical protein
MVVLVAAQLKSGECCGKKKNRGGGGGGKIGPFKSSFFMPLVKITKRVNFCFYLFRNYSLYLSQSKFLN